MNAAGQDLHGLAINSSSFESLKEIPVGRKWGDDGMGRAIGIKVFRIFLCLIGVGVAGAACLTVGWATGEFLHGKLSHPEKATTQAIASRFPETRNQLNTARPGTLLAGLMQAKQQQLAMFDANASVPAAAARLSDAPVQVALGK